VPLREALALQPCIYMVKLTSVLCSIAVVLGASRHAHADEPEATAAPIAITAVVGVGALDTVFVVHDVGFAIAGERSSRGYGIAETAVAAPQMFIALTLLAENWRQEYVEEEVVGPGQFKTITGTWPTSWATRGGYLAFAAGSAALFVHGAWAWGHHSEPAVAIAPTFGGRSTGGLAVLGRF
jgi:hypothetical protein